MKLSTKTRYEVLARCNFACYYCGALPNYRALEVDHVIPRSHGGTDDPWNLVASCQPCNIGKSNSLPTRELVDRVREEWAMQEKRTRATWPCTVCGIPLPWWPVTEDDGPADRCEPCDMAVFDAFRAGMRHAHA